MNILTIFKKLFFIKKSFHHVLDQHFCLHNIKKIDDLKNKKILLGISYCMKNINCKYGRFNDVCNPEESSICKKCQVKRFFELSKEIELLNFFIIKDVKNLFYEIIDKRYKYFIIAACDYSIRNFQKYSEFINISGVSIRLNGHVCNNFETFVAAEKGKKRKQTFIEELDKIIEIIGRNIS